MSEHIKVDENYVESLLLNAAWGAARVPLTEKKDNDDKGDPKAFGGKKGDLSKTHAGTDFEKKA